MILFKIAVIICCFISAIVLGYCSIIINRSRITNRTPIGWWVVGIGVIQFFILMIPAIWWNEWWIAHATILGISFGIALVFSIIWAIIKVTRK
jgi:hypothetical protein